MKSKANEIVAAINVTAEITGRNIKPEAVAVMAKELEAHPHGDVMEALHKCARECRNGRFSLADVLDRLPNQPPSADAAWDLAVKSRIWDEEITLVIPQAILQAWPSALWGSWRQGGSKDGVQGRLPGTTGPMR